jgi:type II secretory pathway component GspD/PulD (secretin)
LPHFRVRQASLSANVPDGHTLVISGMSAVDVVREKNKVPVLGDLPIVGKLFRSERNGTLKNQLIVLVTPTIIDPAGNRLHPEDK